MHGHELVSRLFPLRPPQDENTAMKLDAIRGGFREMADECVDHTVISDEQEEAIRLTHKAMQAWITAVVLYQ